MVLLLVAIAVVVGRRLQLQLAPSAASVRTHAGNLIRKMMHQGNSLPLIDCKIQISRPHINELEYEVISLVSTRFELSFTILHSYL